MPVYLLHGFRWPRPLIRIHIILQNLDDAAAEWLVAPATTAALLRNFHSLHPETLQDLPSLRFIEQYDPNDTSANAASQPYAYVADVVEEIRLGVDVDEVRGRGVGNEQWSAMMELRDRLAPEEKVAWYVVICGDEERWAPPTMGLLQGGAHNGTGHRVSEAGSRYSAETESRRGPSLEEHPKGLKKWFGGKKSRQSIQDTQRSESSNSGVSSSAPAMRGTAA
ncbi:hypothetical protein LTR66_002128 [Elasticomyces elasticus]|nr:hypothetical protein LTR50_001525 [Elasticomyces elasticus]KAK4998699.1 hypothetical protein LTR66_002128 [Elasticomyces elasticus]